MRAGQADYGLPDAALASAVLAAAALYGLHVVLSPYRLPGE